MSINELITKWEKEITKQQKHLKKPYSTEWNDGYSEGCIETISSLLTDLKNNNVTLENAETKKVLMDFCKQADINVKNDCVEEDIDEYLKKPYINKQITY